MKRYNNASGYHHLYDSTAWRNLRKQQFNRDPLCAMCQAQNITTLATVADHVKPHKGDINIFYDSDNLQSLCKLHHDSSKQRQERTGVEVGADLNGYPLDKSHHWYK